MGCVQAVASGFKGQSPQIWDSAMVLTLRSVLHLSTEHGSCSF
jgi:hypothetical protein